MKIEIYQPIVILIDDNRFLLEALYSNLGAGCAVLFFDCPLKAQHFLSGCIADNEMEFSCCYKLSPYFDGIKTTISGQDLKIPLIITDYLMPGIDGVTFCEYVAKVKRGTKCLLMSAFKNKQINEALGSGVLSGYIRKQGEDLIKTIKEVIMTELA